MQQREEEGCQPVDRPRSYDEEGRRRRKREKDASPATLDKRGSAGEQEWVTKSPARDVENQYPNMQEKQAETYS